MKSGLSRSRFLLIATILLSLSYTSYIFDVPHHAAGNVFYFENTTRKQIPVIAQGTRHEQSGVTPVDFGFSLEGWVSEPTMTGFSAGRNDSLIKENNLLREWVEAISVGFLSVTACLILMFASGVRISW